MGGANGLYDFEFQLAGDAQGNTILGTVLTNGVGVTNGLFGVSLDFGVGSFTGSNLWLQIEVRTNGVTNYSALSMLQPITPAPYAVFAGTAGNVSGTVPAVQIGGTVLNGSLPTSPNFSGTVVAANFAGNGANLTNVNAAALGGLDAAHFWQLNGRGGGFVIQDITATTGETGLHPSLDTPAVFNQWGITENSAVMALLQGTASGTKVWTHSHVLELTAPLIIGDSTTNSFDFGIGNVPLSINDNASPNYRDGIHNGTEIGFQINNYAPNGQAGICFSSPVSGSNSTLVMSDPQDICVGSAGGWALDTGLGVTWKHQVDCLLVQLNAGHDIHMLTTVDNGYTGIAPHTNGIRDIFVYDNASHVGQWHWGADLENNGGFKDTQYRDAMFLDTRNITWSIGTNRYGGQLGDLEYRAYGVVGPNDGPELQFSTPSHIWSFVSAGSGAEPSGIANGNFGIVDYVSTFGHPQFEVTSNGVFLFNTITNSTHFVGDIGTSGTTHLTGSNTLGTLSTAGVANISVLQGGSLMTVNTTGTVMFNAVGEWETVYNTSAATISTGTVALPSVSTVGQVVRYVTSGEVTSETVSGTISIGTTVTALAANSSIAYQAINTSGSWIRLQ